MLHYFSWGFFACSNSLLLILFTLLGFIQARRLPLQIPRHQMTQSASRGLVYVVKCEIYWWQFWKFKVRYFIFWNALVTKYRTDQPLSNRICEIRFKLVHYFKVCQLWTLWAVMWHLCQLPCQFTRQLFLKAFTWGIFSWIIWVTPVSSEHWKWLSFNFFLFH